jgi:hypothetical protein
MWYSLCPSYICHGAHYAIVLLYIVLTISQLYPVMHLPCCSYVIPTASQLYVAVRLPYYSCMISDTHNNPVICTMISTMLQFYYTQYQPCPSNMYYGTCHARVLLYMIPTITQLYVVVHLPQCSIIVYDNYNTTVIPTTVPTMLQFYDTWYPQYPRSMYCDTHCAAGHLPLVLWQVFMIISSASLDDIMILYWCHIFSHQHKSKHTNRPHLAVNWMTMILGQLKCTF